jgi:hypothetical protein
MDFKKTTDALLSRIDHADLARELGVSVALIRQARLRPNASAHRTPPADWQKAVLRLAEDRARHFTRLAERLRTSNRA